MSKNKTPSALPPLEVVSQGTSHPVSNKMKQGWEGERSLQRVNVFGRGKLIPVSHSQVWNSQHLLCGHFKTCLCQIGDRLTFHCGSGTFRKNYQQLKEDRAVLLSVPLGGFAVLAFSSHFLSLKTRNEFSLHPRWEGGGTCVSWPLSQ